MLLQMKRNANLKMCNASRSSAVSQHILDLSINWIFTALIGHRYDRWWKKNVAAILSIKCRREITTAREKFKWEKWSIKLLRLTITVVINGNWPLIDLFLNTKKWSEISDNKSSLCTNKISPTSHIWSDEHMKCFERYDLAVICL